VKAAEWGVIDRSCVPVIEWAKVEEQGFDFFTFEEAERIGASLADEPVWRAMIAFGLNTGLRLGELRALRRTDVDKRGMMATVQRSVWKKIEAGTKSARIRKIPLNAAAMAAFELAVAASPLSSFVFTGDKGKQLTKEQCKWPLWRACDQAEVGRRVGWHVLRHTFASHLAMRGVPLVTIQKLMGHSTIQMTMRYAHLAPEYLRDAVLALERPDSAQKVAVVVTETEKQDI